MYSFVRLRSKVSRWVKVCRRQELFRSRSRQQARRPDPSFRRQFKRLVRQHSQRLVRETESRRRLYYGDAAVNIHANCKELRTPTNASNNCSRRTRLGTFSSCRAAHGVPARMPFHPARSMSGPSHVDYFDEGLAETSAVASSLLDSNDSPINMRRDQPSIHVAAGEVERKKSKSRAMIEAVRPKHPQHLGHNLYHSSETPNLAELKAVFDCIDENKDGSICASDLRGFMSRMTGFEMSQKEAEILLGLGCEDGSAKIDFDKFLPLYECL